MTAPLFLDTSFAVALELADDQAHERARAHWDLLAPSHPQILTTSYIACEAVALLQNRGRHSKAVDVGTWLRRARGIEFLHVDADLFDEAWAFLVRHDDKTYSLTDCVSFVLMARLGLHAALTFDRHFLQAGFEMQP